MTSPRSIRTFDIVAPNGDLVGGGTREVHPDSTEAIKNAIATSSAPVNPDNSFLQQKIGTREAGLIQQLESSPDQRLIELDKSVMTVFLLKNLTIGMLYRRFLHMKRRQQ